MTSFWSVVAIAGGIAVVALARATWTPALGLALVVLLLIGAIVPLLGVLFGGIALFYLLFIHGQELFNRLTVALGGKPK